MDDSQHLEGSPWKRMSYLYTIERTDRKGEGCRENYRDNEHNI